MGPEASIMQDATSQTARHSTVVGIFDDRADAEQALQALKAADFRPEQIDVAALQAPEPQGVDHGAGDGAATRVDGTTGILAGGLLGGVAGWLLAATTVAVPGLGALVAAGALVGALGGAGIGAATGGLLGYLLDHGLSQTEASYYHERVRHGAALVIVRAEGRVTDAQTIMSRHGAHDFHTRPAV
jgi:hypothetical protein